MNTTINNASSNSGGSSTSSSDLSPHFIDTDQQAQAARLYRAAFGRAPDAAGLSFWTSGPAAGTATLQDEANALASRPELIGRHGNPDNTGFVNQLYQNVLERTPDAAGLATWSNALAAGTSLAVRLPPLTTAIAREVATPCVSPPGAIRWPGLVGRVAAVRGTPLAVARARRPCASSAPPPTGAPWRSSSTPVRR